MNEKFHFEYIVGPGLLDQSVQMDTHEVEYREYRIKLLDRIEKSKKKLLDNHTNYVEGK